MILKNIRVGLLLVFALTMSAFVLYNGQTSAVNTLPGDNTVVAIDDTTDGQPVNAAIYPQSYSRDSNVVLFISSATNLPNAGGASEGVYVYNITTDTTQRVDISSSGVLPNDRSMRLFQLSETGRYVLFMSQATNLIDGTTKPMGMIYKHDTQTGLTTYVGGSGYHNGYQQEWDQLLGLSNDGRFILATSRQLANTYPHDYNIAHQDTSSGSISWTSIDTGMGQRPRVGGLSCDGAFAVFQRYYNVYLADLRQGGVTKVSIGSSASTSPIISCNGRYVLYATKNLVDVTPTPAGLNTNYVHLVRYDRITGERIYVDSDSNGVFSSSHASTGTDPIKNIFNASIADTGDVVFKYGSYFYLKHLSDGSGTLESVAKTASGSYINATSGTISSDGRYVIFGEDPYNLGLAPSPSNNQIIRAKTGL